MAIGDGMLAQVLLDYFHQHAEEFEQFWLSGNLHYSLVY